jgi:septal ring factor EnvC (AmiA/AmiB activator)
MFISFLVLKKNGKCCIYAVYTALQIEAIKKDSARVVKENNSLHVQLIQQADKHDEKQMEHYQRVKELESEISELSFWKHQARSRLEQSEKENASLKERLKDVMKLSAPCYHSVPQPMSLSHASHISVFLLQAQMDIPCETMHA